MRFDTNQMCVSQPLLAGLMDNETVEFFNHGFERYAVNAGRVIPFRELDAERIAAIAQDMEKHPEAIEALNQLGITDTLDRLEKYTSCRYGGLDTRADMVGLNMGEPEYWPCPQRGNCPHEFKLCAPVSGKAGDFTQRELDVMKLMVAGLMDKEIAVALGIEYNTAIKHTSNIREKLGPGSTAKDIIAFAVDRHIATPNT
jgi:DNA-binding CsgD family transcriptional regulator